MRVIAIFDIFSNQLRYFDTVFLQTYVRVLSQFENFRRDVGRVKIFFRQSHELLRE